MLLLAALKDKSAPFCGFQVEDGIGLEAGADHIEWGWGGGSWWQPFPLHYPWHEDKSMFREGKAQEILT